MTSTDSQVPWTDEQWARVNQAVQEEAARARVGATFLPLYGPLPGSTDFIRAESFDYGAGDVIKIADTDTLKLPTLQVKVQLRGPQLADPDMTSVLAVFRRAANVLARLEDALIFNGQPAAPGAPPQRGPGVGQIIGGQPSRGLLQGQGGAPGGPQGPTVQVTADADSLVRGVSEAIGDLEGAGHFGPFAVVLGPGLFLAVQTPDPDSLVLPQDRILPFLGGGGSLLRSSTLPPDRGVVVALGGAPVELVVATDVSVMFLQITTDPAYLFRVYEKLALRIKEPDAIVALVPNGGPQGGGARKTASR